MSDSATVDGINSRLEKEVVRLNERLHTHLQEKKKRFKELEAVRKELTDLQGVHTAVIKERDDLKTAAEQGPAGANDELNRLRQQVLAGKHEKAWRTLYDDKELGLNTAIPPEKLWALVGYKPEGEPDVKAIKESLLAQKDELGFIFAPPQGAGAAGAAAPGSVTPQGSNGSRGIKVEATEPGLGAGRTAPAVAPADERAAVAAALAERGRPVGARKI